MPFSDHRRARVLVVEDNPADVRLLEEAALEAGVDADFLAVVDGEQALATLRDAVRPDLVLLDLNLPRRNGREVLEDIKQDPVLRSIPVLILSTSDAPGDIADCYARHANCYLVKPLDLDAFTAMVAVVDRFWLRAAELPEAA